MQLAVGRGRAGQGRAVDALAALPLQGEVQRTQELWPVGLRRVAAGASRVPPSCSEGTALVGTGYAARDMLIAAANADGPFVGDDILIYRNINNLYMTSVDVLRLVLEAVSRNCDTCRARGHGSMEVRREAPGFFLPGRLPAKQRCAAAPMPMHGMQQNGALACFVLPPLRLAYSV